MPIPIGPIIGAAVRAAATRGGTAVSASQFARGASMLNKVSKVGKVGKLGRTALLMSAFSGSGNSGSSGMSSSSPSSEPTKKQGLDTYGDGIY